MARVARMKCRTWLLNRSQQVPGLLYPPAIPGHRREGRMRLHLPSKPVKVSISFWCRHLDDIEHDLGWIFFLETPEVLVPA